MLCALAVLEVYVVGLASHPYGTRSVLQSSVDAMCHKVLACNAHMNLSTAPRRSSFQTSCPCRLSCNPFLKATLSAEMDREFDIMDIVDQE